MNACDESLICLTYHHGVHWGYYSPSFFLSLLIYVFIFYSDINKSAHTGNFQYLLVDSVTVVQ